MMMTEAPVDLFDVVAVGPGGTADGELLARVNDAPAGAYLAVVLESIDVESLTAEDLLEFLRATLRLTATVTAWQVRALARLTRLRGPAGTAVEAAFALREPVGAAHRRLHYAVGLLRRLPATLAAMARGDVPEPHARKLLDATSGVHDPQVRAEIEQRVLDRAGAKTANEVGRHARDLVTRLDPDGTQRRNRDARDRADVSLYPDEDGMADLVVHAPVEDAVLVKTAVDAAAATAKAAGDPRPVGVLRAETVAGWAADYLTGRGGDGRSAPRAGGRPIDIGVTIGLATVLGRDDLPGEIPGPGIVPRDVIARMIADEHAKLRLLVIDDTTGRLLHRATDTYRPTPEQIAQVRAPTCTRSAPAARSWPPAATPTTWSRTHKAPPSSATSSRSTAPGTAPRPCTACASPSPTTAPSPSPPPSAGPAPSPPTTTG